VSAVVETADELRRGRESYASRAWLDAFTALSEADRAAPLEAPDLELLATSPCSSVPTSHTSTRATTWPPPGAPVG